MAAYTARTGQEAREVGAEAYCMSRTASRFPSSHFEQPNENFGALGADVKFRADKAGKAAGPAQVPAANGGFQAGKGRMQAAPGYENPDAEADCVIHGHVSFYT